jgi:amidohydrolase
MIRSAAACLAGLALACGDPETAAPLAAPHSEIDRLARQVTDQVVAWRRDIHRHPELSNREFRTAALVARELEALGLEVRTEVAHTGVVGVLRGSRARPVVALRADMDGLPVTEDTGLPFASKLRADYEGQEVGVMHACGHDAHTAMLLGAARALAGMRERIPGTVVFLFQPAEERPPVGEEGGAKLMIEEGALEDPEVDAIFGLHAVSQQPVGTLAWRSGGAMASSDRMQIAILGRQTHAAYPWQGVDPIAAAARVVLQLESIPGREIDARIPTVVSIGAIHGGVRHNIIPDEVKLLGTIRSLDPAARLELHQRVRHTAQTVAAASGAEAKVEIDVENGYPVTWNHPELVRRMLPTLERVAPRVVEALPRTGAEDFAFYQQRIPGFYLWLGVRSPGVPEAEAAPNHSPRFLVDEAALPIGVRALANLALDYLSGSRIPAPR